MTIKRRILIASLLISLSSSFKSSVPVTTPRENVLKLGSKVSQEKATVIDRETSTARTILAEIPNVRKIPTSSNIAFKGKQSTNSTAPSIDPSNNTAVANLVLDINKKIAEGTNEIFADMTNLVDYHLGPSLSDDAVVRSFFSNLTRDIQRAQQREIEGQMEEIQKILVRPLEDLAFSDAALLQPKTEEEMVDDRNRRDETDEEAMERRTAEKRREIALAGIISTLAESSKQMRTREIIRNLNVAPLYYSVALFLRWARKLSAPPMAVLTVLKNMASIVRTRPSGILSYEDFMKNGEAMQAGWKRTGEIAAKGNLARKIAVLRRSTEIWAYFSSFYIKEKRAINMFNSGRWTKERFSEERSMIGAEITQSLLKLGPTFIKVMQYTIYIQSPNCFHTNTE